MATARLKPVLFLAFASEIAGATLERLPEEARRLRTTLRKAEDADWCETVVRQDVTFDDVLEVFQDLRYHGRIALFHYAGHADAYSLLLSDAQGRGRAIHAKGFAAFLAEQPGLDVVVLNGCSTQPQVDDLLAAGVRAVIATGAEIPDEWALAFGERFYAGLAGGSGLAAAFRAAEGALQAELGEQEWPWGLFPVPAGGAMAGWMLKTVQVAGSAFLWVNVPPKPKAPLLGRDSLLNDLLTHLTACHSPALSTDGLPGVGKTALAVALAYDERVRAVLPDGVLWGGLGRCPDIVSVQNQWAEALGLDLAATLDLHERTRQLSAALGERQVLVVLDDAWEIEAARALRLSSPRAVHLLTTRDRKIARGFADIAQQFHVLELEEDTALELLQTLAPEACVADPAAARALVRSVGGLPLAIRVLGSYLANDNLTIFPDLAHEAFSSLGNVKRRLALATERLGGHPDKQVSLEATIRLSVDQLSANAKAAFWALGAFAPKPATFERRAAEAVIVSGQAEFGLLSRLFRCRDRTKESARAAQALAQLANSSLVEVSADGTASVHQLIHDVMMTKVTARVRGRHAQYYLEIANKDREAWQEIEQIYEQLRFAWREMVNRNDRTTVLFELDRGLHVYQMRRGLWHDRLELSKDALRAAQAMSSSREQALSLTEIGMAYAVMGKHAEALGCHEQALQFYRKLGNIAGESNALNGIGAAHLALGNEELAMTYFETALALKRRTNDDVGEARILSNLGTLYLHQKSPDRALHCFLQALPLLNKLNDQGGLATTRDNVGIVCLACGDFQQALDNFQDALAIRQQLGDIAGTANSMNNIGICYIKIRNKRQALAYLQQALSLNEQLDDRSLEAQIRLNIAEVLQWPADLTDVEHKL